MNQDALTTRSVTVAAQAAVAAVAGDRSAVQARQDVKPPVESRKVEPSAPADDARSLHAVAEQIDTFLRSNGRQLQFSVDADSGRTVITVRDPDSGAVVRQIPSEEALRLARSLGDSGVALLDIQA